MSQFWTGQELKRAVNVLTQYEMAMSVIWSMGAALMFCFPLLLNMDGYVGIYTGATILLLLNLGRFYFSNIVNQKNIADDVTRVMNMTWIGSYVVGSLHFLLYALLIMFGFILVLFKPEYKVVGCIMTLTGGFCLIFPSLLLYGIITEDSGKFKAWIIFKFSMLGLLLFVGVVRLFFAGQVSLNNFEAILVILLFMYSSGIDILHYNILLQNGLQSALGNATHQKKITDDPPPYSQVVQN